MSEFLNMGGYAGYVWSSYTVCMLVLVLNLVSARLGQKHAERTIRGRIRREQRVNQK